MITDLDQAQGLVDYLAQQPVIGLDTETTGLDPHQDRVRLLQVSVPGQAWVIDADQVPLDVLKPVLEGGPVKIIQNAKFDWQFLFAAGIRTEPVFDTMLADQVIYNRNFGRGL